MLISSSPPRGRKERIMRNLLPSIVKCLPSNVLKFVSLRNGCAAPPSCSHHILHFHFRTKALLFFASLMAMRTSSPILYSSKVNKVVDKPPRLLPRPSQSISLVKKFRFLGGSRSGSLFITTRDIWWTCSSIMISAPPSNSTLSSLASAKRLLASPWWMRGLVKTQSLQR
jgi:hypothetical protein